MTGLPPGDDRIAWFLHPDRPAWVRVGVNDWLATGDPLHTCWDIHREARQRVLRNHYLVQAWLLLAAENPKGWGRTVALQREITKYSSRIWPRDRGQTGPGPEWSGLRTALFLAHSTGVDVPESVQMLVKIVKSAGVYIY